MLCLPLHRLHYWLAGVSSGSVKDENMRARIVEYQEERADALFVYFMPQVAQALGLSCQRSKPGCCKNDLLERDAADPPAAQSPNASSGSSKLRRKRGLLVIKRSSSLKVSR